MSRIKKQILSKLKEYGSKMGTNTMGGDDYTSGKRGGLRDNDGYDNVQYNKDMPQDESVVTEAKDNLYLQLHKKYAKQIKGLKAKKIKKLTDLVSVQRWSMEEREDYFGMDSKKKKELSKEYDTERKLFKKYIGGNYSVMLPKGTEKLSESVNEGISVSDERHFGKKGIIIMIDDNGKKVSAIFKDKKNADKFNRNKSSDIQKLLQLAKKTKYPKAIDESVNEGKVDRVVGHTKYKYVGDGRKGQAIVSGPMKDREKEAIIKRAKKAGYVAKPNMGGGVTIHVESIEESMFSAIDQIRQDSKDVRDFVKNVFKDREFKKMSNDKDFIKYLKSIYEGINESIPQNFHQGRVSDYHTALRGKNKDYSGGTNFKKTNHGQPDIEEEDEDQETNHLSNKQLHVKAKLKVAESGKKKSDKNYKDWKNTNEDLDNLSSTERIELYKLYSRAMRAMPGSPNQKKIKVLINKLRKKADLKSLPENTPNSSKPYILDDESILKGTPEDKDAIDRDIDESLKDMVGDTYTFSIGSGDEKWIKPNTKEYVIEKIAETIKHNLYDWDFSLNGIDGSQAKEYSKIFDNDVLKPLLRNIDKTLKTYFKIDSKNKKISWKLSFRDNDKIIDAFFKKNKKISSDIRDSYFSQNEVAKRDYKDEYKKFQSSTKSKKYRAELNKYNRDKGTYGNGDGKDASHKGGKIVGFESASKNRGRKEKSRLKKK